MFWPASSVTAHWLSEGVEQSGEEASFAFPYRPVTAHTAPQPGIEQVPHGIAEHVEGVDDKRQTKPRRECQPRRLHLVFLTFPTQHAVPARSWAWPDREWRWCTPGSRRRYPGESPSRCRPAGLSITQTRLPWHQVEWSRAVCLLSSHLP